MTQQQKEKKLATLRNEIDSIEQKIDKLLFQRENLESAYAKIQAVVPKDPTPVSKEDREKQSQKDKELYDLKLKNSSLHVKKLQLS